MKRSHADGCGRAAAALRRSLTALLAAALVAGPGQAQRVDDRGSEVMREIESLPLPRIEPPAVALRPVAERSIPGPLAGSGPTSREDRIGVRVAAGTVSVPFDPALGFGAEITGPLADVGEERAAWGLSPDGRVRAQVTPGGQLVVETACRRCDDGWNRRFKLRVPGDDVAPPLVTERRVFYGAGDNVVYCIRRDNGHRVWEHDAGGRIVPRLVLWSGWPRGAPDTDEPISLVFAVPDQPAVVLALDARTGERAAVYDVGPESAIVGAPLVLADGRIVIARQDYRSTDAALVLLELVPREEKPTAAPQAPSAEQEQHLTGPHLAAVPAADLDHLGGGGKAGPGVGQLMERLHHLDRPHRLAQAHPLPDADVRLRAGGGRAVEHAVGR